MPRPKIVLNCCLCGEPVAQRADVFPQLEALRRAECHKIFSEQISTRVKVRPELEKALTLARQFSEAAPDTPVILTVHELKRLARNAAELMTLAAHLQAGGIRSKCSPAPSPGSTTPTAWGRCCFRGPGRGRPARPRLHPRQDPGGPADGRGR